VPTGWPEGGRWVKAPTPGPEAGIEIHVLPSFFAGRVGLFALPGLGALIRRIAPDILHSEEAPFSIACWQVLRAAVKFNLPALFFTWENMPRRYRFPLEQINQRNFKRADWAIAGNREAEAILRARGYQGPVDVFPQYGVDPEVFQPMPEIRGRRDKVFTIGYFGRLLEEKGIHTLLRACALLEFQFRLIITGKGNYEMELRRLTRELGLEEKVGFQPVVDNRQAPQALNRLDVLVLPSETRPQWKEQFGRVLIEAMACEIPVIGSSSGEIPYVIEDAGLIFPEGDAAALARQLTRLRREAGLAADLAKRGRERALSLYTTARIAGQTYDIYRQMLPRSV